MVCLRAPRNSSCHESELTVVLVTRGFNATARKVLSFHTDEGFLNLNCGFDSRRGRQL